MSKPDLPKLDSADCRGLPCNSADPESSAYCDGCVRRLMSFVEAQRARFSEQFEMREAEHARRCDLERRFDRRLAGDGVVDKARALCHRSTPPSQHEINEAVTALVLLVQAREAEQKMGPRPEIA